MMGAISGADAGSAGSAAGANTLRRPFASRASARDTMSIISS